MVTLWGLDLINKAASKNVPYYFSCSVFRCKVLVNSFFGRKLQTFEEQHIKSFKIKINSYYYTLFF